MVATKPTPGWVVWLLKHCSADEQSALNHYRATVGRAHAFHRRGELTHAEVTKIAADALEQLADAAGGSPQLDQYLDKQRQHLEQFVTDGTAAA